MRRRTQFDGNGGVERTFEHAWDTDPVQGTAKALVVNTGHCERIEVSVEISADVKANEESHVAKSSSKKTIDVAGFIRNGLAGTLWPL